MESQPVTPHHEPVVVKEKTKSRPVVVVLSVLFLLTLAGAGILGYVAYSQSQTIKTAEAENERLSALSIQTNNGQAQSGGKDFEDEDSICKQALNTVEAVMSTDGVTRQQTACDIRYLDDKYARVNVNYTVYDDSNGKQKPSGKGETFYMKKVSRIDNPNNDPQLNEWALVGINPISVDEMQSIKNRYGLPDKVFTADQPA